NGKPINEARRKGDEKGEGGIHASRNGATGQQPPPPDWPGHPPQSGQEATPWNSCTLIQYAEAKRLPVDFLRRLGLSDMSYLSLPAVRMPHLGVDGAEIGV